MWSVVVVVALVVVGISLWFYRWANPRCNGKLPPGSMGFPIIGENLEYFKRHGFNEIQPFIKKRMLRYGPLFRTSILGSKTIVSTDPEVNYEILRQENKSFVFNYPDGFVKMFGKNNNFFREGNIHKNVRQISLQLLGADNLKRRIIHDMDRTTREHLKLKADQGVFEVKDAVESLVIAYMTRIMISDIKPEAEKKLIETDRAFTWDFFTSPFNLSAWKALYNGLAARRNSCNLIKDMFRRRKASKEKYADFMGLVLERMEKEGGLLNEKEAIALISTTFLVSHDNTSTTTALAVKFISENAQVLAELKREHEAILRNRADKESGVTWEEYRSMMTFTHMVINESLRLTTLASVMFRRALHDIEVKGYTIPAGWMVLVAPAATHYDPEIYDKPWNFNPWRWEGKELFTGSKTFMVFGGGARLCSGAEFARLQMAIFLHYLVTNYEFSLTEEVDITRAPLVRISKGVSIKISES